MDPEKWRIEHGFTIEELDRIRADCKEVGGRVIGVSDLPRYPNGEVVPFHLRKG